MSSALHSAAMRVEAMALVPVSYLDLLERHAEPLAQLDLRHAEGLTPSPDLGTGRTSIRLSRPRLLITC